MFSRLMGATFRRLGSSNGEGIVQYSQRVSVEQRPALERSEPKGKEEAAEDFLTPEQIAASLEEIFSHGERLTVFPPSEGLYRVKVEVQHDFEIEVDGVKEMRSETIVTYIFADTEGNWAVGKRRFAKAADAKNGRIVVEDSERNIYTIDLQGREISDT